MEAEYEATVTDMPAYVLSIAIDGQEKQVLDYVGRWEGMPTAITELEGDVDALGRTRQWVQGEGNKHGHPSMSKKVCMGGH
jgi:hypothetical protein